MFEWREEARILEIIHVYVKLLVRQTKVIIKAEYWILVKVSESAVDKNE